MHAQLEFAKLRKKLTLERTRHGVPYSFCIICFDKIADRNIEICLVEVDEVKLNAFSETFAHASGRNT